jgi:hypothetical protein
MIKGITLNVERAWVEAKAELGEGNSDDFSWQEFSKPLSHIVRSWVLLGLFSFGILGD